MARGGQLRVRVVGDTSNLSKSLSKGTKRIGAFAKKAAKVGAAGVAALGAAAVAGAAKVASFGDDIAKSSQKAGLGVEQFQELRFAFKQGGVEAGTFDTAMQKFNKRLGESATTGGTADEAFERLGVSLRDANGNVADAGEAMDHVLGKLADIESDAERAAIAGDLFGQRAGPELAAALSDGGEGIEAARQKAQDLGIVMGEDAVEKSEKFTDAFDDLKQSAMGLLRKGLTPVMGWLADDAMPFIQSEVIPRLKEFGKWLGPKLEQASAKIVAFFKGQVIPAFAALSAWWETNGPTIMGHAKTLWGALQRLGDIVGAVVGKITNVLGRFGDSSSKQTKAATDAFQRAKDIISSAIDAVVAIFKTFVATGEAIWRTWGDTILRFLKEIWSSISQVIDGALTVIEGVFETFAGLFSGDWSRMWDGIKQIFAGVWDAISGILDAAFAAIRGTVSVFRKAITSVWSDLWNAIKLTASNALDAVVDWFKGLPNRAKNALSGAWSALSQEWTSSFTSAKDFASNRVDDVVDFISDLPSRAKNALSGAWDTLSSEWTTSFTSVKDFASDRIDDVVSFVENLPKRGKDALSGAWDTLSSEWESKFKAVKDFASNRVDDVVGFVGDLPNRGKDALSGAWSTLSTEWESKFNAARKFVGDQVDKVIGFFRDLPGDLVGALADAWDTFDTWVDENFTNAFHDKVDELVGKVLGFFEDLPDDIVRAAAMLGGTVGSFFRRQMDIVFEQVKDVGSSIISWFKDLPGRIVDALKGLGESIKDRFTFDLPGINFSGKGDGPGMGAPDVSGKAAKRAAAAAEGLPIRQTSGYRTPAENRAVDGSPTSYHLNKDNPATDWGGPTWALDMFAARLREMGGWRELLWRTSGHYDHVHVAHEGGTVTGGGVAPLPGEVIAKLQSGETVLPRGAELGGGRGGGVTVQIDVHGSLIRESELVDEIGERLTSEIRRKTGMRD